MEEWNKRQKAAGGKQRRRSCVAQVEMAWGGGSRRRCSFYRWPGWSNGDGGSTAGGRGRQGDGTIVARGVVVAGIEMPWVTRRWYGGWCVGMGSSGGENDGEPMKRGRADSARIRRG